MIYWQTQKNQTLCKVVQILAELAKVGEYINRFI
jgi:hypothetical protein